MQAVFAAVASVLASLTRPVLVWYGMPLSWGDLSGFVTGIACVWLTARANIWNFPLGVVNSAILGLVFFEQRLVASLSLAAQWLLNRRMLETWGLWIVVDLISIPLYLSRGLPLIAALYALFLGLCCQGFLRWRWLVHEEKWGAA